MNKPQMLVRLAEAFVGICEFDPSGMALIQRFKASVGDNSQYHAPWCLSFVQFVVREVDAMAGGEATILPLTESTVAIAAMLKPDPFLEPAPGQLVLWQELLPNGGPSTHGHVGIVTGTENNVVETIEANTSKPLAASTERTGGYIWKKTRFKGQIHGFLLRGYVSPWKTPQ